MGREGVIINKRNQTNANHHKPIRTKKEDNIMATMTQRPIYEIKVPKGKEIKEPVADKHTIDKLIDSLSKYLSNK